MFSKLSAKIGSLGKRKPRKSTAEKVVNLAFKDFDGTTGDILKEEHLKSLSGVDETELQRRLESVKQLREDMGMMTRRIKPPAASTAASADFPPMRPLDDFLLSSARFDLPSSAISWPKRIKKNLLYYQTNYAVLVIVVIICAMFLHPAKFIVESLMIMTLALWRSSMIDTNPQANRAVASAAIFIWFYLPFTFFSTIVAVLAFMISLSLIILHASLRLRNLGNKIQNTLDKVTLKETPMGLLLNYIERQLPEVSDPNKTS